MEENCGRSRRSRWADVIAVSAIGALSATTIIGRQSDDFQASWLILDIAVALVACGLILVLPRRRIAEARTLERTKMAREMHDVLAHRLSLLATYAGALEYRRTPHRTSSPRRPA